MQKEEDGSKYNKWFIGFLIVFIILLVVLAFTSKSSFKNGNVAVIKINGEIGFGKGTVFGSSVTDADDIIGFIDDADKSSEIKAILFEIDSPGGSAVASQEIVQKIQQTKKPTFAVIRETGASGAYWIASATKHITASPMSITGSVGVVASYLEFGGLLDNYNISYQRIVSGNDKDIGTPFREPTREEKDIFQTAVDSIKQIFLDDVTKSRKLTPDQVVIVKTARFFTGAQAKELNLVDDLGTKADAIKYVESQINETAEIVEYNVPEGFFKSLTGSSMQNLGFGVGSAIMQQKVSSKIDVRT